MAIAIDVNGQTINYPEIGDTNWADEATDFAVQTASAFGKLGLDIGTTVDIPGTLDVTGNTTLDANLSVTGNTTITGNLTANGNSNLGNASGDTIAVTGILNVDSGVLYVNPTNNRVGINDTTPSVELDVNGSVAITGNTTVDGVIYADDNTTANTPVISFTGDTNTGIGRSAADTIDFITNGNSRFRIESTGQLQAVISGNATFYPGYLCRAWINFDGSTGSGNTIRGSGNVSSVTRNSTGTYTISIDIDMPDANYVICGNTVNTAVGGKAVVCVFSYSSGSFVITTSPGLAGAGLENSASIFISVFR